MAPTEYDFTNMEHTHNYKPGDRVRLLDAPLDKADRIGKVYEVTLAMVNGVCIKIDDDTFMTVRAIHIEPE